MEINAPIPRLKNKSFRINAQVDYKSGDEGVLFACGFNIGGYTLYVEDNRLCFHFNYVAEAEMDAVSNIPLPEGQHEFGFAFDFEEPGKGIGYVTVDGAPAGEKVRFNDTGFMVKSCIGVGRYASSAVKRSHKMKPDYYAYTGDYRRVDLFIGTPETIQDQLDAIELHRDSE